MRLELLEARKSLAEKLLQALPAFSGDRLEPAHRTEAFLDDPADELAAAAEVTVGGSARHSGGGGHLGDRDHPATTGNFHRVRQQLVVGASTDTVVRARRGHGRVDRR